MQIGAAKESEKGGTWCFNLKVQDVNRRGSCHTLEDRLDRPFQTLLSFSIFAGARGRLSVDAIIHDGRSA